MSNVFVIRNVCGVVCWTEFESVARGHLAERKMATEIEAYKNATLEVWEKDKWLEARAMDWDKFKASLRNNGTQKPN